jgi:flagellar hook protein FlgE
MSINSALLAGVAGLKSNSSALAVISDNIANVNTNGYKRSEADFQTLVTGSSRRGSYNAGGVTTVTRRFITQEGQLEQTTSSTDLGIDGPGFFVVTEKAENVQPTDTRSFTRMGSFTQDNLGFLRNTAGLYLQGWPVDAEGVVNKDPSDLSRLESINVTELGGTADPTTRVSVNANLDAGTPINAAAALTPPAVGAYVASTPATSMARFHTSDGTAGVRPDFTIPIPVLDSQGGKHTFHMSFLRDDALNPNTWHVEIYAENPADLDLSGALHNGQIKTGRIRFDSDGRYDALATAALPDGLFQGTPPIPVLTFEASAATPAAGAFGWATPLGVSAQEVRLDLDQAAGGITQSYSKSETIGINSNGTPFGALDTIEIDQDGFVTAEFKNGVRRRIAQVAIATFQNPNALTPVSGSAFRVSQESGTYNLKASGDGGAGTINPASLETSNVDLSTEFTNLITTQRAYSASSKIITTADEMMEELLRVKR